MKKVSLIFTLAASVLLTTTGCLKDKDFEDQKYGVQVQERKAVSFPQSPSNPVANAFTSSPNPVNITGPFITVEASGPATSNINVKLAYDPAAAAAMGLTPLPAGSFSLNTLDVVIPKDSSNVKNLVLTIRNSDQLNPNLTYGMGFKIVSADNGYQVASNMNTVVFSFAIKNKYDGVYRLKGYHTRPGFLFAYDKEVHMITRGPNEVNFYLPEAGFRSNGHYIGTNAAGGYSWYGDAVSPSVRFNTTTDLATEIYNLSTAVPIAMMSPGQWPAGTPVGSPSGTYAGGASGVSRFVDNANPTQRMMYLYFMYNGNPARGFIDTLTYIGPRP